MKFCKRHAESGADPWLAQVEHARQDNANAKRGAASNRVDDARSTSDRSHFEECSSSLGGEIVRFECVLTVVSSAA